ncbi:hypothetical protein ODV97_18960 [Enterococcus gallinarum]|nr:hypothetical protein [Enterococcus gallinarum]
MSARKGINYELFVRQLANVCYENSRKVVLVKESYKDKPSLDMSCIIEYDYFDELNFQFDLDEDLENTYYESLKNVVKI